MISDIIEELGASRIARELNVTPQAVHKWKTKGVPLPRVRAFVALAPDRVTPHDVAPSMYPPGFAFPPEPALAEVTDG